MPAATDLPLKFDETQVVMGSGKKAAIAASAKSGDLWMVPIDQIHTYPGFNVRSETPAYVERRRVIADSIKRDGFMRDKPLAGFAQKADNGDNLIYIVGGHTRLAAAKMAIAEGAEVTALPVIMKPPGTSLEDLTAELHTGNLEASLNPLELGVVCHRMTLFGRDTAAVAARLGLTENYVKKLLTLVGAPVKIRQMVESGEVSASLAIETLREHGKEAAKILQEALKAAPQPAAAANTNSKRQKNPAPAKPARATKKTVKKVIAAARQASGPMKLKPTLEDFLRGAMHYTFVAADGLDWLANFLDKDADTVAELEAHMGQPAGAMEDRSKRVAVVLSGTFQAIAAEPEPSDAEPELPLEPPAAEAADPDAEGL